VTTDISHSGEFKHSSAETSCFHLAQEVISSYEKHMYSTKNNLFDTL